MSKIKLEDWDDLTKAFEWLAKRPRPIKERAKKMATDKLLPVVWRITHYNGSVKYIESSALKDMIPNFNYDDMTHLVVNIGAAFSAVDVRPLYDLAPPAKLSIGRLDKSSEKEEYIIGQRVILNGDEIGTIIPKRSGDMAGYRVNSPSRGYDSVYAEYNIKPLPNGQL